MSKKNKIQIILDKYLKYRKNKVVSDKQSEQFWTDAGNSLRANAEEMQEAKDISDFFAAIKTRDLKIQKEDNFEDFYQKIDFANKTIIEPTYQKRNRKLLLQVAAILVPVLIITSVTFYYLQDKNSPTYEVISTLKGSKTKIVLEDGTTVWLNSDSELKYPSTFKNKDKRIVNLIGEAYFDVSKNEKQPFEVFTAGYKLKVLGTAFNVKAYPGEGKIQTTLEHGKVNVIKLGSNETKAAQQIVSLEPKQTIVIYDDGKVEENQAVVVKEETREKIEITEKKLEKRNAVLIESKDLSPYLAWKDSKLVFNETKIVDMVNDLERWYNIDVKIADDSIKKIVFTATFTTETADQAIKAICLAANIDYEIDKNKVILKTK